MTRVLLPIAVVLVTASACKKSLPWGEKKATELVAGPYKVAIPAGWRDISELQSDEIKSKLPSGVVGIMPEKVGNSDFQANIVLNYAPFPPNTPTPTCQEFADEVSKGFGVKATNVATITIDNTPSCRWAIHNDTTAGVQVVRFDGEHELVIQCLRSADGDLEADAACNTVLDGLHVPHATKT